MYHSSDTVIKQVYIKHIKEFMADLNLVYVALNEELLKF